MKPLYWVLIGVAVIALIAYAIYSSNKRLEAQHQDDVINNMFANTSILASQKPSQGLISDLVGGAFKSMFGG